MVSRDIYISVLCRADVSSLREKYKQDTPYARERQLAVFRRLLAERQGSLSPSRSRTLNIRNVNSVHFGSKKKKTTLLFLGTFKFIWWLKRFFFKINTTVQSLDFVVAQFSWTSWVPFIYELASSKY